MKTPVRYLTAGALGALLLTLGTVNAACAADPPANQASSTASSASSLSGRSASSAVNDMYVEPNDVIFHTTGSGTYTSEMEVRVGNAGSAAQQGVSVDVIAPPGTQLTDEFQANGIDGCVPGQAPPGRSALHCQVHDAGPKHMELGVFHVTATVPLPTNLSRDEGAATLNGYRTPDAHPEDNAVNASVSVADKTVPEQNVDLRASVTGPTLHRASDGTWSGTVTVTADNAGGPAVPDVVLQIHAPVNVTVSDLNGDPQMCYRLSGGLVSSTKHYNAGLRCRIPLTKPGDHVSYTFGLKATTTDTQGSVGVVSLWARDLNGGTVYEDPTGANKTTYQVAFA